MNVECFYQYGKKEQQSQTPPGKFTLWMTVWMTVWLTVWLGWISASHHNTAKFRRNFALKRHRTGRSWLCDQKNNSQIETKKMNWTTNMLLALSLRFKLIGTTDFSSSQNKDLKHRVISFWIFDCNLKNSTNTTKRKCFPSSSCYHHMKVFFH